MPRLADLGQPARRLLQQRAAAHRGCRRPAGVEATLYDGIGGLPHFNPDDDPEGGPVPAAVAELRARLAATDALLFCTPEYAGALPGSSREAAAAALSALAARVATRAPD